MQDGTSNISLSSGRHIPGSVIVSGGLGALGLVTSLWLGVLGKSDIWLIGRLGRTREDAACLCGVMNFFSRL